MRFDVDVVGTYTIEHPFGQEIVVVDAIEAGPEINVSLDIPAGAPPDFVQGAAAGQVPTEFFPAGAVLPLPGQLFSGTGSISGDTLLRNNVVINRAPGASALNGLTTDSFTWAGKFFEHALTPSPNVAPLASPDLVGILSGNTSGIKIDAVANDIDLLDPGINDHGINPRGTGPWDTGSPGANSTCKCAIGAIGTGTGSDRPLGRGRNGDEKQRRHLHLYAISHIHR